MYCKLSPTVSRVMCILIKMFTGFCILENNGVVYFMHEYIQIITWSLYNASNYLPLPSDDLFFKKCAYILTYQLLKKSQIYSSPIINGT